MNTVTEQLITAPRHIRFLPNKIKQLRQLMMTEFTTTIFVVHTHEYVFHEPQPSFALGSTSNLHDAENLI